MKMKKGFLLLLLVLVGVLTFSVQNVSAAVESNSIDMMNKVTIDDGDTYLVKGYNSYTGDTLSTEINMLLDFNFVKIVIHDKSNSAKLTYILEVEHNDSWTEVKRVTSTQDSGVIDLYTPIYKGRNYRLRVYNVKDSWFPRSSSIDVEWWAIR